MHHPAKVPKHKLQNPSQNSSAHPFVFILFLANLYFSKYWKSYKSLTLDKNHGIVLFRIFFSLPSTLYFSLSLSSLSQVLLELTTPSGCQGTFFLWSARKRASPQVPVSNHKLVVFFHHHPLPTTSYWLLTPSPPPSGFPPLFPS